jgi:hypothetical protein
MIVRCNAGQAEASLDTAEAEASLDSAEDGASLLTKAEAEAIALKGAEAESRLEAARVRERLDAAKEKILEDTRNIELYNDEILTGEAPATSIWINFMPSVFIICPPVELQLHRASRSTNPMKDQWLTVWRRVCSKVHPLGADQAHTGHSDATWIQVIV